MSKIIELDKLGQSIWYDYIQRSLLTSGEFERLMEKGVSGITSNPAIFEKAIAGSNDYDNDLKRLAEEGKSVEEIYEILAIGDIFSATDLLKPVYDRTNKRDGYVSLEVSPNLAYDTEETVAEARRLFEMVNRQNLLIKVPATPEGIPAVAELIGAGVNVNITLIFGLDNYRHVAEAYLEGLKTLAANGPRVTGGHGIDSICSVASFFISRIDTVVDQELEKKGNTALQGKIAIASAKMARVAYDSIFDSGQWNSLAEKGARVQRLLWGSTGTKNPRYPDTLYVDQLIGPDTINTVPPATLDNFLDHGTVDETLSKGMVEARIQLDELNSLGINLAVLTQKLQEDGVEAFRKPFAALMDSIAEKCSVLLAG